MIKIPPLHSHVKVKWIDSMAKQGPAWTHYGEIKEWVGSLGHINSVGYIMSTDKKHLTICSGYIGEGKEIHGVLGVFSIPIGCIESIERIK